MTTALDWLKQLSRTTLQKWAGETIFKRGVGYLDRVHSLSQTEQGALAAWVSGSQEEDYATSVQYDPVQGLQSSCSCPYGGVCKHRVALLLAAEVAQKKGSPIPLLEPSDDLYWSCFSDSESGKRAITDSLRPHLESQSHAELLALLLQLAGRFSEVNRYLHQQTALKTDSVNTVALVKSLRKEIRRLTRPYNRWDGDSLPDYTDLIEGLDLLLQYGYADIVLELSEEIWSSSIESIEQSDDEGELASEISLCLDRVLEALPESRLPRPEQLFWLFKRILEDDYGLLNDPERIFTDPRYTPTDWQEVARRLEVQLREPTLTPYRRKELTNWLQMAYQQGGEEESILPLLEQAACQSGDYTTLIDELMQRGEYPQALQWAQTGLKATPAPNPRARSELLERCQTIAQKQDDRPLEAAYVAHHFWGQPSLALFQELNQLATPLGIWPAVRAALIRFVETGICPDPSQWPLPPLDLPTPAAPPPNQAKLDRFLLIDLALFEQRYEEAVALFEQLPPKAYSRPQIGEKVAQAVAVSHPDSALAIWRTLVEQQIGEVKLSAYERAARILTQMHRVYQATDRLREWSMLLLELRNRHSNKRRLVEILLQLESGQQGRSPLKR